MGKSNNLELVGFLLLPILIVFCVTNSYSAFGNVTNTNAAYALNRYKYNGKEMERTHGIDCLDYGARWYEPVIGRFTTMDPLSEKYYHISPYAYCGNNPINYLDKDGREKIRAINPNSRGNKNIIVAADRFKDHDDIINIWAHGSATGMTMYYSNINQERDISDSKSFEAFLNTNSNVWKNRKEGNKVTIVLHSCETGAKNGFAQKISADIPNAIIIAPTGFLYVMNGEEIGSYRTAPTRHSSTKEKGEWDNNDKKLNKGITAEWIQYENGKPTYTFKGDMVPWEKKSVFNDLIHY